MFRARSWACCSMSRRGVPALRPTDLRAAPSHSGHAQVRVESFDKNLVRAHAALHAGLADLE